MRRIIPCYFAPSPPALGLYVCVCTCGYLLREIGVDYTYLMITILLYPYYWMTEENVQKKLQMVYILVKSKGSLVSSDILKTEINIFCVTVYVRVI